MYRCLLASCLILVITGCGDKPDMNMPGKVVLVEQPRPEQPPNQESIEFKVDLSRLSKKDRVEPAIPHLTDIAHEAGLDFVYNTGSDGRALMVESTGGGGGWLDYDCDGQLDLFCVQGGNPTATGQAGYPQDVLFRQIDKRFTSVGPAAAINEADYGQGVAVGDYDEDGFDDLYVTNVGQDRLWRNRGDGTFAEIAEAAGMGWLAWKSSAAWADLDDDGDLDLYVCSYTDYDVNNPLPCPKADGQPGVCHPENVEGVPDECYQNNGDGTFSKVAAVWGLAGAGSKSLGVVIADLTEDGQPDIYVANDTTANFLFVRERPGQFHDEALERGCALSGAGMFQASMGIGVGDYDHNSHLDLYVTHFTQDYNTLYSNRGGGQFVDYTSQTGLVKPTLSSLAFGAVMADLNFDGCCDLLIANGHIDDWRDRGNRYKMNPQLFSFNGVEWIEQTKLIGGVFSEDRLSRAIGLADFDNDADLDCFVINQNDKLWLLENQTADRARLQVRLIGTKCNRRGVGAKVTLRQASYETHAWCVAGGSYCASHDLRPILTINYADQPIELAVTWPDGSVTARQLAAGTKTVTLQQPQ